MRTRQAGGRRKKVELKDEILLPGLLALMDLASHGHTLSPLIWTCKSLCHLNDELKTRVTRGGISWWASFSRVRATACSPMQRNLTAGKALNETPNSSTSTLQWQRPQLNLLLSIG